MSDDIRPIILVVDDTPDNLKVMSGLLKDLYRVKIANGGEKALAIAVSETQPDLILLDIMMPDMDGHEVCRRLKSDERTRDIPVIFLTAKSEVEDEEIGLSLGAVDYITKPISPPIVMARVAAHLKLKAGADFLRDKAAYLEAEVGRRTREITAIQDVTILAMASLAETRDSDTGNHIRRTQHYIHALADKLRNHPRFSHYLDDSRIDILFKSAPLHDIGKVGIPDRILLKPGRFEPHEFEIMKTHTTLGRDAIEHAERSLGMPVEFLACAKEIAYAHQEKWDGSGYPLGLSGDDIPISARLMAVADVYDALISRRVYKDGMPHEKAVAIIAEGAGSHFDPDIAAAFIEIQDQFQAIARRFADSDGDMERKKEYLQQAGGQTA
ncbi:response regulator [Magnetospirillum gryphiswaldense]|uniref:Response regulator receiver:Metal-dependent phosphohydrolase, HD subdomain n=1 Tax=Magnetospirillum gryphiswaldense TaxID=55518 RepID=A4TUM2_9PROT|nr:two-component system response regulator [Magnetospirillum gryphiswaldense]AVM74853.1 Cyclic di-GMP phosphodiesterase response regulator RpfG [Magnetospirillum gryphiswaldense MSR-1]AVM78756.1 Cyclic di-GMP phosphodiesterase response regulator RpfG [Magnetospirillum gryphiswaldense]CAM74329.1 Response regulator receiver:Metal-dependent phosphohydrolase, HD subdomain [Magnetospirillum gryphiswaldense MSR-1]